MCYNVHIFCRLFCHDNKIQIKLTHVHLLPLFHMILHAYLSNIKTMKTKPISNFLIEQNLITRRIINRHTGHLYFNIPRENILWDDVFLKINHVEISSGIALIPGALRFINHYTKHNPISSFSKLQIYRELKKMPFNLTAFLFAFSITRLN